VTAPTVYGSAGVYRFVWKEPESIVAFVSRLRQDRNGNTTAEIRLEGTTLPAPHLHQARLNLTSSTARHSLAKQLSERYAADWSTILEQLAVLTLERERAGEPVLTLTSEDAVKPRPFLLPPLLPEREPTVVFGPGGSGKSLFALFVGMLVASGTSHRALGLTPTRRTDVLYLDWETHEDEVRRRIKRLTTSLRVAHPVKLLYRRCVAPLADDVEVVQETRREHNAGLIVIDSLAPACGGGEDLMLSGAATVFFQALRRLDTTALIVAHPSKNSDTKSIYGSVFFTNLARSVWEVVTYQGVGEDSISLGFFHRKSNLSRLNKPFGVELTFAGDEGAIEARPRDVLSIPSVSERASVATRIARLLDRSGALQPKDIAERIGILPATVRKELQRMHEKGSVVAMEDGCYGAMTKEEDDAPFSF